VFGSPDLRPGRFTTTSGYSITVDIILPVRNSRFLAIPLLGFLVRGLLRTPHFIALSLFGIVVVVAYLTVWIRSRGAGAGVRDGCG
jgi:hypothetical protein